MKSVQKFDVFEYQLLCKTEPVATFICDGQVKVVNGFQTGSDGFAVRFMPECEGVWKYHISADGVESAGEFTCVPNTDDNHGPVVAEGTRFRYADGTQYIPVGTTCYAWIHQPAELIAETLETLKDTPFNKIRMCVFPKHMPYNQNEPMLYPFEKNADGKWDVNRPDERFWVHLEGCIGRLRNLGIEADLILFHPYDRWGFSKLSMQDCLTFLDYCIRRLSAYRNIWWSLANEYDLMPARSMEDWEAFGNKLHSQDLYQHLISVHHCLRIYPKAPWMTHCSIQSGFVKRVAEWQREYGLPVMIDECGYEGNIEFDWGNLSAFEMVHRAWVTVANGGFITHGETFFREDEVLWWAKGGKLYGQSPARFAFLKALQYEIGDVEPLNRTFYQNPNDAPAEVTPEQSFIGLFASVMRSLPEFESRLLDMHFTPSVVRNEDHRLHYIGRQCPCRMDIQLPQNGNYKVEIIDVWEMTRETALAGAHGSIRVGLPGKEGIAVLVTRLYGDNL